MKNLKKKLQKQGGFTLVEMLIVVAIIAILIAVSIPMMNSNLEKAREAVDEANARDAVSLAAAKVLTDGINTDTTWHYVVNNDHTGSLADSGGYKAVSKKYTVGTELTVTYTADTDSFSTSFNSGAGGGGG